MYYTRYDSPIGTLTLVSDGEAITGLYLPGQKYNPEGMLEDQELPVFQKVRYWLDRYFAGENPRRDFPVKAEGSAFRQSVWALLMDIPYGKTMTYGQLAAMISRDMSPQAVGGAVGHNPVSIVIPCHRVLGAGGKLTGYAGGVEAKRYLLDLEEIAYDRE